MKKNPYRMRTYEGETANYDGGISSRETTLLITVEDDPQEVNFDILPTGPKCDMILGHPWLKKYNPDIDWENGHLNSRLDTRRVNRAELDRAPRSPEGQERPCEQTRHTDHDETMSTDRGNTKMEPSHPNQQERWVMYVRPEKPEDDRDNDSGYETSEEKEDLSKIPKEYQSFTVFRHKMKNELPARTAFDHEIKLKEGAKLRYHKAYHLGPRQDKALQEYIKENLPKGFIKESQSEAAYPILFVPKKGTTDLRLVVDYRQLNEETIKNRYPLPLIREMKDRLAGAQWFSRLDLPMAFGHIRIKEGDEWKTAFRTRYGHFEYQVMPFGLTNAPATFQSMIDHTLRPYLDRFAFVYLDDILIYSKTLKEHRRHVRQILQTLQNAGISVNPRKSEFHTQKTIFLGFEITPGEIRMEPAKIAAIREWPTPTNQKEVRMFIGFINFYRSFVKGFGGIAKPLHELTGEGTTFEWTQRQQDAFNKLKDIISSEPVLRMPDFSRPFYVETDASDFAVGAELYQIFDDGRHPVGFVSKKISGPALNYPIHDKELMAIIEAFDEWRPYLSGIETPVDVFTDHRNLKYFVTKELSPRQIRWAEFLAPFNFRIHYVKGKENARADALSRRPDHKGNEKIDAAPLFKEKNGTLEHGIQIWEDCARTYRAEWEGFEFQAKRKDLELEDEEWEELGLQAGPGADDPVWSQGKAFVPQEKQRACITKLHSDRLGGHPGIRKTLERVRQHYAFPGMKKGVEEVVKECEICTKSKAARHKPYGLLEPLPTADRAWGSISMDFITKLPSSTTPDGTNVKYDSIWVVVDRLTKWAYFVPFRETTTAEQLAYLFERNIVSQHGLPDDITSDRDKLFTSKFWQGLMKRLDVKSKLSTAFHPQTDGQTERLNQVIEQYLRCYINFEQDNWVDLLPTAQLAYNSASTETTNTSPFFANYGFQPELRQGPTPEAPRAAIRAERLQDMHNTLKETLEFVRERMRVHYDKHRVEGPPLEEGDKVFLLTRNLHTKRPSKKLDFKKIGPFKIKRKISTSNYELDLPDSMRVRTKVFHISLLEPAPRRARLETQLEAVDDEEEFDVEIILDSRISNNELQYLVKWMEYGPESNSWEPADFLNCPEKLQQFHRQNPDRPGPRDQGLTPTNRHPPTNRGYQRPQRTTGDDRPLRLGTPLPD